MLYIFIVILYLSAEGMGYNFARSSRGISFMSHSHTHRQEKIELYSTLGCKYCRISKAKLKELGLHKFTVIDVGEPISTLDPRTAERLQLARLSTVPQIFVGEGQDAHVGGCREFLEEVESGQFENRLKALGIKVNKEDAVSIDPGDSSSTADLIDLLYRDISGETILNGYSKSGPDSAVDAFDASSLAASLQRQALLLTDIFASEGGTRVSYSKMATSLEFKEYIKLSSRLRDISLSSLEQLPSPQRFSLFVNLYNALIMHATCVLGSPADNPEERNRFFSGQSGAAYEISGLRFSPNDIEHGILRANTRNPYATPEGQDSYWLPSDVREGLCVSTLDPRVHFVLNCGAASCPPIKILGPDPEPALAAATATYLSGDNLRVSLSSSKEVVRERVVVTLPKLLFWYRADFGNSDETVLRRIVGLLGETEGRREDLMTLGKAIDRGASLTISYLDYDWSSNEA